MNPRAASPPFTSKCPNCCQKSTGRQRPIHFSLFFVLLWGGFCPLSPLIRSGNHRAGGGLAAPFGAPRGGMLPHPRGPVDLLGARWGPRWELGSDGPSVSLSSFKPSIPKKGTAPQKTSHPVREAKHHLFGHLEISFLR